MFCEDRIRTLVSMATDSSHRVTCIHNWENLVTTLASSIFISYSLFLQQHKGNHIISDGFEIMQDPTRDLRASCH